MPRSQPPTVEKLTTDFLKLSNGEQKTVLGVFTAITKSVPKAQAAPGAPVATVPAAPARPVTRRAPKPRPTAAAEATDAPPVDTE